MYHRGLPLIATLLLVPLASSAVPPADAQSRSGTFKAETVFVEVDAIVTDDTGAFVDDLTIDDFAIVENEQPRATATTSLVTVPVTPRLRLPQRAAPIEPDVRASSRTFTGRLYVLVLDDLHTAFARSELVQQTARAFLDRYLGANDLAAIVYTSGRQDAGQELTGSHKPLAAAVGRFQGQKLPSAGMEKLALHLREEGVADLKAGEAQPVRTIEGLQRGEATRDPYDAQRILNARRMLQALGDVASWLADVPSRRKAILLFSEGIDYDIYEPFDRGAGGSLLLGTREAITDLQRANVAVYGVDPRALNAFGELIDVNRYSDYPQLPYGTFRGALRELLLAQESLIALSESTGGLAVVDSGDVVGGLGRIVLDNSRYYLLGFYSDADRQGRPGSVTVKVKRPGLHIRASRRHLAAAVAKRNDRRRGNARRSAATRAVMGVPLPVGDLPLRAFAAPFKGEGRTASVVVALELDGGALPFREVDGRFTNTIEVSIVAADARAKVQGGDEQTLNLQLRPETAERVTQGGLRFLSRLDLAPGRYQIRVGASESVGNTSAMVPYDIEVPDFAALPLGLSGVILTSSEAGLYNTVNADERLQDVLPSPPHVTRAFAPSSTLSCFAELYANSPLKAQATATISVIDARTGAAVFTSRTAYEAEAPGSATFGVTASIPLRDIPPGSYVLTVRAASPSQSTATERALPFTVVGENAARSPGADQARQ